MNIKQKLKDRFRKAYLFPQEKKWVRVVDALAAVFCFVSAVIVLYLLNTQPEGKLPTVYSLVVWGYLITSLPLALLLYNKSDLKKNRTACSGLFYTLQ